MEAEEERSDGGGAGTVRNWRNKTARSGWDKKGRWQTQRGGEVVEEGRVRERCSPPARSNGQWVSRCSSGARDHSQVVAPGNCSDQAGPAWCFSPKSPSAGASRKKVHTLAWRLGWLPGSGLGPATQLTNGLQPASGTGTAHWADTPTHTHSHPLVPRPPVHTHTHTHTHTHNPNPKPTHPHHCSAAAWPAALLVGLGLVSRGSLWLASAVGCWSAPSRR